MKSKKIVELIKNKNLKILNDLETLIYYFQKQNKSGLLVLNLTFVINLIINFIRKWRVKNNLNFGSDHKIISFYLF